MPTITSAGTGDWGTGGTWVGGAVPSDGDAVVIDTGHTVTFNVDQSAWVTGIAGLTITGTLKVSATTSSYMFIKAATTIAGAGTFNVGTQAVPIPFAVKFTLTGGAGWKILGTGGLTMTVYAAEPAIKTVLLTGAEAIGSTVLEVDTDVTADIWAVGDTIRIDNINKLNDSEERVIAAAGIAAGAITITVGLTASKIAGTVISLITRNVKFIGVSTYIIDQIASGKLTIAGGQWTSPGNIMIYYSYGASISGGTFSGSDSLMLYGNNSIITGGVFSGLTYVMNYSNSVSVSSGSFTGNSRVFWVAHGFVVTGGVFKGNYGVSDYSACSVVSGGLFVGNCEVFKNGSTTIGECTISGNYYVLSYNNATFKNVVLSSQVVDATSSQYTAFNTLFGSAIENSGYNALPKEVYSESFDHDQVASAFRAWTRGGITSSQAVTLPTGYTQANQTVLENANQEGYWQREITVGAGASVNIEMWLRKDGSMSYLPRVIIFNKALTDPFAGGAGVHTFTMTDSVDTWETETYTYGNVTANDVTLIIRCQGKAASGNMFSAVTVEQINVDLTDALDKLDTIDTVVDAIKAKTDNLPSDPADESLLEAAIAAIPTAPTVDNILDEAVEGAYTVRQALRILLALTGKTSGGGTATIKFRDVNDTKDRIVATVDVNGNRSVVVLDAT